MTPTTAPHKSIDDRLKEIILPNGKSYYHAQLQRWRFIAIVLTLAAITSLIFLVFAFVQKAAADTAREQAVANEVRAVENEKLARQFQTELQRCQQLNGK